MLDRFVLHIYEIKTVNYCLLSVVFFFSCLHDKRRLSVVAIHKSMISLGCGVRPLNERSSIFHTGLLNWLIGAWSISCEPYLASSLDCLKQILFCLHVYHCQFPHFSVLHSFFYIPHFQICLEFHWNTDHQNRRMFYIANSDGGLYYLSLTGIMCRFLWS